MRKMFTWMAAAMMLAAPVMAENKPVVVELYTSQGCSSCPPADALLHELAARDDVIALALHVDYWDYIGWKDSFGSPEHSARQRSYARANNRKMVYTPQMIINGAEHVVGNRPRDVVDLITKHKAEPSYIDLTARREGDALLIRASAGTAMAQPLVVQVLRYMPKSTVDIRRGENAGRTISYANVVTELQSVGLWNTSEPFSGKAEVRGDLPIVVLLQAEGHGPVAAALRIE